MEESLAARLASSASSDDAAALADLGFDLATAEEHIESAWCFQRAAALDEVWSFNYGHELLELRRYEAAVEAFACAASAGHDDAWDPMGRSLEQLGDLAGAMRAYDSGLMRGDVDAGMGKAFLLRGLGERSRALEVVEELAANGSAFADAVAACWSYDASRDPLLEDRLRAGAELFPSARAELAHLLKHAGRFAEALEVLQRGVELMETESFLPLGNLLSDDLDDADAAEAAYRRGIEAGDLNCHNNLGVLLEEQDRIDEARQQYELAVAAGDSLAERNLSKLEDDELEDDELEDDELEDDELEGD